MTEGVAPLLTTAQFDRVCGVLPAQACGDALGVPYEFASLPPDGQRAEMRGGGLGPYEPGEYSDDTQMAVCIARVAATGADLTDEDALDEVAAGFLDWVAGGASDVGVQTRGCSRGHEPGAGVPRRGCGTPPVTCTPRPGGPPATQR